MLTKPLPRMLTRVRPSSGPMVGVSRRTVGSSWYTKCSLPPAADTAPPSTLKRTATRLHAPAPRRGVRHCTASVATNEPATPSCPKWQRSTPRAKSSPVSVTSEPPTRGPAVGRSVASRIAVAYSKCAPFVEKSIALLETCTIAARGERAPKLRSVIAGVKQTSTDALRRAASLVVPLKRQTRYASSAERAEKCMPCTVTGVPPSAGPALGATERTTTAAWNSNGRCSATDKAMGPFANATLIAATPAGEAGVTHWIRSPDTHAAGEEAKLPKWQASGLPRGMPAPETLSNVPPSSGPRTGWTLRIVGPRYEKRAPSCVKSSPFIVSCTHTSAAACGGDAHSATWPETRRAALSERSNRQSIRPSAAARAENGPPRSATSVPPPTGPWRGERASTVAAATYSKR